MSNFENNEKYKFTSEGIIKDRPKALLIDALEKREKCPDAFLLSEDEIKLLYKARDAILEVAAKYRNIPQENYNEELQAQALADYAAAFGRKRVPLKKIQKLEDKMHTQLYWSASLCEVKMFGKYGLKPFERYSIKTSTPEQFPESTIDPETNPAFFAASNTAEMRRALGLSDLYLYLSQSEFDIIQAVCEVYNELKKQMNEESTAKSGEVYIPIVNSPEMNALICIGGNARKKPEQTFKLSETGEQINIYEYLTNLKGVKIAFEKFNPLAGQGLITVGDPNTDKLLLQAQALTLATGQQELEIPISEFMRIRGLNDRKNANEKARGACDNVLSYTVRIDASCKNASIYGGFNYVQECYVGHENGRGGNRIYLLWSNKVYKHLMEMKNAGRQIEFIDPKILSIPDNHGTAYIIARVFSSHLRKNAGKPTARRLSVKNVLSYCTNLRLYPEEQEQYEKKHYIRKRSEAAKRIIKPFINELKYLVDTGIIKEFNFTHEGGRSLSKEEHTRLENDYEFFSKLVLELVFNNEPQYEHLIESKTKQIEKTKKAKKTPKDKK